MRVLPLGGGFKPTGVLPAGKIFCSIFFRMFVLPLVLSGWEGWYNSFSIKVLRLEESEEVVRIDDGSCIQSFAGKWIVS